MRDVPGKCNRGLTAQEHGLHFAVCNIKARGKDIPKKNAIHLHLTIESK